MKHYQWFILSWLKIIYAFLNCSLDVLNDMYSTFSLTDQIIYNLQNGGEPWGAQFLWLLLIWT